ncbi:MAG: PadR family transcriptional regulator [Desulfobacteraceae bacterium]|nr:PadR family transcriptional regulator [Desulfobacteraceae bacterium]
MNISKFLVLGTLDHQSPASGYGIIRELDKKMISRWTNVKKGSIYHALKALAKVEQIRETERIKQGQFPTMTLYEITDAGRQEFDKLQAEAFLGLYPYYFGFKLALKFNSRRTISEIAEFGEKAIEVIDAQFAGMDAYLNSLTKSDLRRKTDPLFIEHDKMLLRAEKQWIQKAIEKMQNG